MDAAVFLDRDNTLIDNDGDLGDPAEVKLLRGAASAVASLRGLGYKIVVISNQGGVARGKYTEKDVQSVHQKISELVEATSSGKIDRYYFCPFHPEAKLPAYKKEHPWRKPQPGMLFEAARQMELDLSQSWTIGDQLRDIEAGAAAGTRTILLTDPKGVSEVAHRLYEAGSGKVEPDFVCRSLTEAARIIAQQRRPEVHPDPRGRESVNRVKMAHERAQEQQARDAKIRQAVAAMQQSSGTVPADPPAPAPSPAPPPPMKQPSPPVAPPPVPRSLSLAGQADAKPSQPSAPDAAVDPATTLREILQELRHQRDRGDDFGPRHIVAVALQVVAVVCLIVAFSLSSAEPGTFLKALGAGLMVQLMVVTVLMFRR